MNTQHTDYTRSVTAVVFREGKVLLARHTYGGGKGKLIVPGGYLEDTETPEEAVKRECLEETGVAIRPEKLIGIRFGRKDWYAAFSAEYVSGEAVSDHRENSEVLWMDPQEALSREDVPGLTKSLIQIAVSDAQGFVSLPDDGSAFGTLYGPGEYAGRKAVIENASE